jgi:hypothetical protein
MSGGDVAGAPIGWTPAESGWERKLASLKRYPSTVAFRPYRSSRRRAGRQRVSLRLGDFTSIEGNDAR